MHPLHSTQECQAERGTGSDRCAACCSALHAPILALANDPAGMLSQHYSESIDDHRKVIIHCCMDANRLNIHNASSYLVKPIVAQVVADSWSRV